MLIGRDFLFIHSLNIYLAPTVFWKHREGQDAQLGRCSFQPQSCVCSAEGKTSTPFPPSPSFSDSCGTGDF